MLRVVPLGGLGEIGLNAMLLECRGERVLVDCGLMFPDATMPGVGVIVPDLTALLEEPERLKAVVLTHGHEDHVGAIAYLLRQVDAPVYGTPFTLALVRHRLEEEGVPAELRELSPRHPFKVGESFEIEPVRVTHSMPDAVGLIVRTPEGTLVHTGDFKLDDDPIDGLPTDLERMAEEGERGVLCLLSDSTNSEYTTETGSERRVAERFEQLFAQAQGRVFVAMFASNVNRLRHTLELCERTGRKVVLQGRSLERNVRLAEGCGALRLPPGLIVAAEESHALPDSKIAVLCTGAQAEPRSALSMMLTPLPAREMSLRIHSGDLVIVSSRAIPGNERLVGGLLDRIVARGARLAHGATDPGVHVSGHASMPQQRRMLEAVRPAHFVPVHGELRHLHRHLQTAREVGVPQAGLFLATDGDVIEFQRGQGALSGTVPIGRIFKDRFGDGTLSAESVAERGKLAELGVLVAVLVVDGSAQRIISGPHLTGRGLSRHELEAAPSVSLEARRDLDEISKARLGDEAFLQEELARAVRRAFRQHTRKRPQVIPLVVKL